MPITLPIPNSPNGTGQATAPNTYYPGTNHGEYQFISLTEIVNNFMATYVGEGKILGTTLKGDVNFHAHRALQELSYDTLKSCKSQEIEVCPSLKMPLPHDYVNYVKITSVDKNGIERIIYPTRHTSNPFAISQDSANCTDCGDSSDSYEYGSARNGKNSSTTTKETSSTPNTNLLKEQEESCDTVDITCSFDASVFHETTHLGGNQIYQYLNASSLPDQDKFNYWNTWFAQVDKYCICLKNSEAEENCGEQLDWSSFNLVDSGRTNVAGEINNRAGWTGLRHPGVYPNVSKTQATNGTWEDFTTEVTVTGTTSNAWSNYSSTTSSSTTLDASTMANLSVDSDNYYENVGQRYGINPQFSQANGSFYIDCLRGMIHFGSNFSGETIILHYISDGNGTDDEMIIHKFAEEAMYKWIAYGCASARIDVPEGIIQRLKREKFSETRKAKIRLSNVKIEEISQVFRGKSKWIKH